MKNFDYINLFYLQKKTNEISEVNIEQSNDAQNPSTVSSLPPVPSSSDNDSQSVGVGLGSTTAGSTIAPSAPSTSTASISTVNLRNQHYHHPRTGPSVFTYDPWLQCLSLFFSQDFIFSRCPQARSEAWPFIYARLQQLLPLVDPNEQPHESTSRASILFGVGANSLEKIRRAASERDANLALWKNYLMGACCLTSGSDKYLYLHEYEKAMIRTSLDETNGMSVPPSIVTDSGVQSPTVVTSAASSLNIPNAAASAINVDFTVVESTSKFYATFGTATSLLKMIVPFLKCECNYFREIIIRGKIFRLF